MAKVEVKDENETEKELLRNLISVQEAIDMAVEKIISFEDRLDQLDDKIDGIAEFVSGYKQYKDKILKEGGFKHQR